MQTLDYLKQSKCPEGQPAGRDTLTLTLLQVVSILTSKGLLSKGDAELEEIQVFSPLLLKEN